MVYAARLRGDARRWRDLGIIDAAQEARIVALAAEGGSGRMQVALALCAAVCAATAAIAFTASNWAGMGAGSRLLVLLLGNALSVAGAWWASTRRDEGIGHLSGALAEGFSVLSLAVSAATIALVGQTFHVEPDPRGFALTVAALGAATALASRSGGAALLGCAALALSSLDLGKGVPSPVADVGPDSAAFWLVAAAYAGLVLTGRARSGTAVSLALLAAVTAGLSGGVLRVIAEGDGLTHLVAVAAAGLGIGHALARLGTDVRWLSRASGEALSRGASGLALVAIVILSQRFEGAGPFRGMSWAGIDYVPFAWLAAAGAALALPRLLGRGPLPTAHLAVLGALASSVAFSLLSTATVWVGVLPCLALVVSAHVHERRALFWWSVLATAGLSVWLLVVSSDLAGLSLNLLGLSALLAGSVAAGRTLSRRTAESTP